MNVINFEIFDASTGFKQDLIVANDKATLQIIDEDTTNFLLCINNHVYEINKNGELIK